MKINPDWLHILRRAWSIRFMVLTGIFGAMEIMLPIYFTGLPRGLFALLSLVSIVGGMVARVMSQKGFE